jgi:hypothetical protein
MKYMVYYLKLICFNEILYVISLMTFKQEKKVNPLLQSEVFFFLKANFLWFFEFFSLFLFFFIC